MENFIAIARFLTHMLSDFLTVKGFYRFIASMLNFICFIRHGRWLQQFL